MKLVIRTAVEMINVSIGKNGDMYITGNKSGMRKVIKDKVRQLSELFHLENVGTVVMGDVDAMRRGIKNECPSLSSIEQESSIIYNDVE